MHRRRPSGDVDWPPDFSPLGLVAPYGFNAASSQEVDKEVKSDHRSKFSN